MKFPFVFTSVYLKKQIKECKIKSDKGNNEDPLTHQLCCTFLHLPVCFFFFNFYCGHYCRCPPFAPLFAPSSQPLLWPSLLAISTLLSVFISYTHTCSLANPFNFFHPAPLSKPSDSCHSVSLTLS